MGIPKSFIGKDVEVTLRIGNVTLPIKGTLKKEPEKNYYSIDLTVYSYPGKLVPTLFTTEEVIGIKLL